MGAAKSVHGQVLRTQKSCHSPLSVSVEVILEIEERKLLAEALRPGLLTLHLTSLIL